MANVKRIYFEDKGQDFLWWDIDTDPKHAYPKVVDCGPFQGWLWTKYYVLSAIRKGSRPTICKGPDEDSLKLNYKIVKIEDRVEVNP